MNDRVKVWMHRKETHAHDPLLRVKSEANFETSKNSSQSALFFIASFNGREIARTKNAQVVNCRIYFPFQDIRHEFLMSSSKRWR